MSSGDAGREEAAAVTDPADDEAGDAVCWLERVCERCGALEDGPPRPACPRCGAARPPG